MGQLLAWMLIALIAPVLPSGDALPEAVFAVALGTYFLLFLFNEFAFANYYFLLQAMLLASGGVAVPRSPSPVEPAR